MKSHSFYSSSEVAAVPSGATVNSMEVVYPISVLLCQNGHKLRIKEFSPNVSTLCSKIILIIMGKNHLRGTQGKESFPASDSIS